MLKNADIDFDALCNTVITVFHGAKDNYKYGDGTLVFDIESNMITVSLVDAPIPNGEPEFYAKGNFLWRGCRDNKTALCTYDYNSDEL